jgi:dTDP-glucose 4,6-dehydratase
MANILITGGAGFIGSEFTHQISETENSQITIVDSITYAGRKDNLTSVAGKINFQQIDIRDKRSLESIFKENEFDYVVNFAAESHVDNSITGAQIFLETNIYGTLNLLELARDHGIQKFLQVSTDEVYGSLTEGFSKEEDRFKTSSPYSASKASAEHFVQAFQETFKLPTLIVRCSNNYGPRQYPEKLIPFFIKKLIANQPVPVYGSGKNIREWIHVSDCARGILRVLELGTFGEAYNISSGEFKENLEIARDLIHILNKDPELIQFVSDRKGHDFRYAIDSSKIMNNLGWEPQIKFDQGLASTVDWYMNNQERFN